MSCSTVALIDIKILSRRCCVYVTPSSDSFPYSRNIKLTTVTIPARRRIFFPCWPERPSAIQNGINRSNGSVGAQRRKWSAIGYRMTEIGVFHGWAENFGFDSIPPETMGRNRIFKNGFSPSTRLLFDSTRPYAVILGEVHDLKKPQDHSPSLRFLLRRPLRATVPVRVGFFQERQKRVRMGGKRVRCSSFSCGRVWESAKAGSAAPLGSGIVQQAEVEAGARSNKKHGKVNSNTVCHSDNYCRLKI